jgi:hypothetical protein
MIVISRYNSNSFFLQLQYFVMFFVDAQLVTIGQYDKCEWINAKYKDLRTGFGGKLLALLIQSEICGFRIEVKCKIFV